MEKNKTGAIILAVLLIIGIYFVFIKKDSYIGFYYPDENDLTEHIQSQKLGSLDECHSWVKDQEAKYNPSGYGYDYECGKNCDEPGQPDDLYICEETLE